MDFSVCPGSIPAVERYRTGFGGHILFKGDEYETKLENIPFLDRSCRGCRWTGGVSDEGRYPDLQVYDREAAFVAAGNCFSDCMVAALCPDGHWRCQGEPDCEKRSTFRCAEFVYRAACGELLLESDFLQCPGFWVCVSVAAASVAVGSVDDYGISIG